LDGDDLFYSDDDDLDAYFHRGLDEIEKDIEYSDPKKSNPGRRRTTTIVGGPAPPDYTGMDSNEIEDAKALYKVQRKAYVDQIRRQRLKKTRRREPNFRRDLHWLSPSSTPTNVRSRTQQTKSW
jgi:hypothetical protein